MIVSHLDGYEVVKTTRKRNRNNGTLVYVKRSLSVVSAEVAMGKYMQGTDSNITHCDYVDIADDFNNYLSTVGCNLATAIDSSGPPVVAVPVCSV
ncbi:hypothetical protein J6590_060795 [Homalodisca vitripennis]|nr:hypothetical protein J6590_060795 [Homalodisca vitripennis]